MSNVAETGNGIDGFMYKLLVLCAKARTNPTQFNIDMIQAFVESNLTEFSGTYYIAARDVSHAGPSLESVKDLHEMGVVSELSSNILKRFKMEWRKSEIPGVGLYGTTRLLITRA